MAIQDFGEKIGGAKKDQWKARGLRSSDLLDMTALEKEKYVKKDSVWPKLDYKKMYEDGMDKKLIYSIKLLKDSLPASPNIYSKDPEAVTKQQNKYIEKISDIRDQIMSCKSYEEIKDYARGARWKYGDFGRFDNACRKIIDSSRLEREITKKEFLYTDEEKLMKPYSFYRFDPACMNVEDGVLKYNIGWGNRYFHPPLGFEFKPATWFVVNSYNEVLLGNFSTREEAYQAIKTKAEAEQNKGTKTHTRKKTYLSPLEYKGVLRRTGFNLDENSPATGEMYLETFAFKGGEFGNWMSEKDRQNSLNFGYEALKDMATALGVEDTDIGRGQLSIAFGARGSGLAAAHYEPARDVINLTKPSGAGSLAHEMMHAFDYYCGNQFGLSEPLTKAFRHETPESFQNLMNAINTKTVYGDDVVALAKKNLDCALDKFKQGLHNISRCPDEKEKYERLINNVIEEAKSGELEWTSPFDKKSTFSPAYEEFCKFQKNNGDTNPACARNKRWSISQQNTICELLENIEHPQPTTMCSDFVLTAEKLQEQYVKSGGEWSSEIELFARAGAAYIKDKLAEKGVVNDYLCGHADLETDVGFVSPQGKEREDINKAFDLFFDDMKERGLFHQRSEVVVEKEQPVQKKHSYNELEL